jgi:hypothetical protein
MRSCIQLPVPPKKKKKEYEDITRMQYSKTKRMENMKEIRNMECRMKRSWQMSN